MIQVEAIKVGLRVQKLTGDKAREIYTVDRVDSDAWILVRACDSRTERVSTRDLSTKFVAIPARPFAEFDLRPIVGREAVATLRWGTVRGRVGSIVAKSITIDGIVIEVPISITIDGEIIGVEQFDAIGFVR